MIKGRLNYEFKHELDCATLSSIKARYLEYANKSSHGLSFISKQDLLTRFAQENERYLNSSLAPNAKPLSDLDTYRYSYLAPSFLQVGGKTLSLLNRGESLYDPEQYKEMLYSISLLKSNPAARSMTMPVLNMPLTSLQQSTNASSKGAAMNFQAIGLLANYGIAFKSPTPAKSLENVNSDPLEAVSEILGENTLLAIANASKVSDDTGNEDSVQITELLNTKVADADATAFATSLVSTLVNLGMNNFRGVRHNNLQVAEFSPQVKEEIEFSRTLDFYNLSVPTNGLDSRVISSNSLVTSDSDKKIRSIPNQIKSIFLTKTNEVTPTKDWFTMDTDPMADPNTRPLFEILYFNLQQIEVLTGFSIGKHNSQLLRSPNYELLTPSMLTSKGKLLCRLKKYRNDSLHIGQTDMLDLPVMNDHFVINLSNSLVDVSKNPIIESDLITDGSEYKLPNGTNYIGSYHIHKDGTVMSEGTMTGNEQILTPLTNIVTTKARASQVAARTLLGSSSTYEKEVMQGLVANHYDQISVTSEYCITAPTIPSTGNINATKTRNRY